MKKFVAISLSLVILVLCFAGCARSQKTYYTDKENFEMKLYPDSSDGSTFSNGLNAVQIVMNTPNVESGSGEVKIFRKSDDHMMVNYDVRMDEKKIFINTSKEPAYSQVIIPLPEGESFESGETYYVTMDEKAFYIDDIKGFSGLVEKGDWEFTIADYGYDGNISEMPITYLVGDTIEVPVKLSSPAATAILLYDDVAVAEADLRALTENGKFEVKAISAGTVTISVMFLDSQGKYLETLAFSVTVK